MKVRRLDHVGVVVDDLEEASRLLENAFGLAPVNRIKRPDVTAVFFSCGSTSIEIIEVSDPEARRARLGDAPARIEHIAFEVEELDDVLDGLEALGIRSVQRPRLSGSRRTFFTDAATTDGVIYQFLGS